MSTYGGSAYGGEVYAGGTTEEYEPPPGPDPGDIRTTALGVQVTSVADPGDIRTTGLGVQAVNIQSPGDVRVTGVGVQVVHAPSTSTTLDTARAVGRVNLIGAFGESVEQGAPGVSLVNGHAVNTLTINGPQVSVVVTTGRRPYSFGYIL